ncbi:fam-b protein [Plasmodium yoelii]|nr:fam-b protein [Plasmodium yoelii]WBY59554.1 fam-b protein [Plasmodium yoelii yoelii]VTZ80296.1 fam-b protein [Plasmodium yoelii]|eukprot:XP_724300.2 fam-b protein [Plasmodium yoelii]
MRVSILKYVFFSIIICFFEYDKNELCLERSIINFRNNRVLAYADNQFDLNDFYQSTLSLANQFNEYNDYDYNDDKEISFLRNTINSHIKKHKENNALPDLNNVDKRTRKLINELRAELEEVKKELDNKRNNEIVIRQKKKKITKKDKKNYASEDENSEESENEENSLETKNDQDKKTTRKILKRGMLLIGISIMALMSGTLLIPFIVLITLISADSAIKIKKLTKFKLSKLFK